MLNNVTLMGRLTADPELRHTQNGVETTKFTIAVDRDFAPQGEDRKADFVDIRAWRKSAEFACKYFKKGDPVVVIGRLCTDSYTDSQGVRRKSVEVVSGRLYFSGSKRQDGDGGSPSPDPYGVEFTDVDVDTLPF